MNSVLGSYTAARLFVLAAKPLSILFILNILDSDSANKLALFYLVGSISTVLFSFSTFRVLIPKIIARGSSNNFYGYLQNIQILCIGIILFIISLGGYFFSNYIISASCVIALLEFACHEKQRNFLYNGKFKHFARLLFLSYVSILTCCFIFILMDHWFLLPSLMLLFMIIFICRHVGLARYQSFRKRCKLLLGIVLLEKNNWLISGMSRVYMSADRLIFTIVSFDSLWLITILSQYFMVPILIYDLFHLGPNKHNILKSKNQYITKSIFYVLFGVLEKKIVFLMMSCMLFFPIFLVLFGPSLGLNVGSLFAYVTIFFGFLYGFSEKLHEIIFWSKGSSKIIALYMVNFVVIILFSYYLEVSDPVKLWLLVISLLTVSKFGGLLLIKQLVK